MYLTSYETSVNICIALSTLYMYICFNKLNLYIGTALTKLIKVLKLIDKFAWHFMDRVI